MSTHTYDVAIVSAFGRGELLAGELKTRGMDVALIDVSGALGARSLADLEGPFPMVRPNPLLPAHLEWLMSHSFEEVPNGVCLWLPDGPIEFRGPLAGFYASMHPAVSFFRGSFSELNERRFDERWIAEFAYSFCSKEFSASTDCHLSGEPFPLTQMIQSPIFRADRFEKTQEDLQATGVQWLKANGLGEVEMERGRLIGLEVDLGRPESVKSRNFVWCLSSEETASMSGAIGRKLFPRGIALAKWVWRRFQVHSPKNSLDLIVPPYVILIDDIHFPWAYDNLVILKRRKPGLSDVWVRLPSENSRKPDQLKKFTKKLEDMLQSRFHGLRHEVETFWDEGPPLYPIFEPDQLRSFAKPEFGNLIFEGAEVLPRQDWAGRFQMQAATMSGLMAKKKREKSDDIALHAP